MEKGVEYVAFFHPFCDSGGGGERVLFNAIKAIMDEYPEKSVVIYCWKGAKTNDILKNVEIHFGISLQERRVIFIKLQTWKVLEAYRYPFLTLILSSIGSMIAGWEAIMHFRPTVVVESVGYAFVYPIFKLFGAKVVSYVHYPTISSDMLRVIQSRTAAFNNPSLVAKSKILTMLKVYYYNFFSILYKFVGSFSDVVLVNSTWTDGHIKEIWQIPSKIKIVYPPCDTQSLINFPLENRNRTIISVAQFRPEKDHTFQISIIERLLSTYPEYRTNSSAVKLVFIGSVRNDQDAKRVEDLQTLINEKKLQNVIHIVENASYQELLGYLESSLIGLHVMKNEHFGISIIEYMVAGLIPVAHNSGGPKMDIVSVKSGFLADDIDGYVEALHTILKMDPQDQNIMQQTARRRVIRKFSENVFIESFLGSIKSLL
jgi:alpha-1,2-mannosyltransferase